LKSLILSLLPALEDETSEDFDRAFRVLELLEQKFSSIQEFGNAGRDKDGYFWQCLFLAVITSSSRRQGALNFLSQKLPKFTSLSSKESSAEGLEQMKPSQGLAPHAEAVISPEPGLLIRCFACGLSDSQALIQRGYLDLLVTHLPLNSPLLQARVRAEDMDRLVSSAAQVLLRREMSLNRRLWSWLLGPDSKANETDGAQNGSQTLEPKQTVDEGANDQLKYFSLYGRKPLERCILASFARNAKSPVQRAQPFRICLSLMDRWEIGGSIIPQIFVPAIENAYQYNLSASTEDTAEVFRSASLFFDGIEATLIWQKLLRLLRDGLVHGANDYNLRMFDWVVRRFNITDEEMLNIHVPYALTYALSILSDNTALVRPAAGVEPLFDLSRYLLDLIPERAFPKRDEGSASNVPMPATTSIRDKLDAFYEATSRSAASTRNVFGTTIWTEICYNLTLSVTIQFLEPKSERYFVRATSLLISLHTKACSALPVMHHRLFEAITQKLFEITKPSYAIPFPIVSSIVSLISALGTSQISAPVIPRHYIADLIPMIVVHAWQYLSPSSPKYNVEAVRSIWQLEELLSSDDSLQSSLMSTVRDGLSKRKSEVSTRTETCRRFSVLWNHTVPAPSSPRRGSQGFSRKGSAMSAVSDVSQAVNRQKILTGPLMLLLDELHDMSGPIFDSVRSWLRNLNSLDQVFKVHFESLSRLLRRDHHGKATGQPATNRSTAETIRHLEYIISHLLDILRLANNWIWQCLQTTPVSSIGRGETASAAETLAQCCIDFLRGREFSSTQLQSTSIEILDMLLSSPIATELRSLDLGSHLLDLLMLSLSTNMSASQGSLLKLTTNALRLRSESGPLATKIDAEPRSSFTAQRTVVPSLVQSSNSSSTSLAMPPPPQLLNCLKLGFSSPSARSCLDQWLAFLSSVLPFFADAIFTSLIPLVECLCGELDRAHETLVSISQASKILEAYAPEAVALALLDALELVLARAHECLALDQELDSPPKPSAQPRSILGNMTSGVFKSEALPTRTTQANSRLTVILTFQDAIRVSTKLWTWASHSSETADFDKGSAATTTYNALKLRNRTRYLLEQIFDNEPLESLEVLISIWCYATNSIQASATLDLLHVMQGMRPKNVVPTILDAICSRTNLSALPSQRQSSQTVDLSATEVSMFLFAYLQSIEDDAMDEVWSDCLAFLRDVLSNPLPHRQILPSFLLIVMLLAQKIDNTNFGEQRKMRRDLGDVFLRLLGATFTTMPSGHILEPLHAEEVEVASDDTRSASNRKFTSLPAVLAEVTLNLEVILETSDRVQNAINNISNSLISPIIHAKSFPSNINSELLSLFLQIAKRAPTAKQWKKDLADALNEPKLLTVSVAQMERGWFPLIRHWCLYDKERMPELLSRLSPPSSAGIMFGVGASAARLEADRKTQLNLRRICILLLASPEDSFVIYLRSIEEKLIELFDASSSSSPSASIKAELFMLCRALVLSTSIVHLAPFWPVINDNLQHALMSLTTVGSTNSGLGNLTLLQACKLLDILIAVSPEEFQLHEWLYVTDTVDAVYQPTSWSPAALSDCVAEGLAANVPQDGMIPPTPISNGLSGGRRPLISNSQMTDLEDIKASTREDFAHAVIRPFLSQLSLHAYEGVYSMETTDLEVCRHGLLEDLLDLRTIVE
jgi:hypothetical protein